MFLIPDISSQYGTRAQECVELQEQGSQLLGDLTESFELVKLSI